MTTAKKTAAKKNGSQQTAAKKTVAQKTTAKKTAAKPTAPELPVRPFKKPADWVAWLEKNHARAPGVWVQFAKKNSGIASLTYAEAVEGALCYGWIDGQARSFDEMTYLQKFTPRRPRSIWSQINREKALALIANGQMQPAGLAAIEQARQNGQWEAAYAGSKTIPVPDDLQAALDANPTAKAFFETLTGSNRYAILFRLQTAKKVETRARRLAQFITMLEKHEKFYL